MTTDREAIEALIYGYAEAMDTGDFRAVGAFFEDASYGPPGGPMLEGADALASVLEMLVIRYDCGTPRTKHVTTNVVVEVAGSEAGARGYFSVLQQEGDRPLATIVAGRYADTFVKEEGRWRFTTRTVHMDLVGDTSRHLRS